MHNLFLDGLNQTLLNALWMLYGHRDITQARPLPQTHSPSHAEDECVCKSCAEDIISRAHSGKAHQHRIAENALVHGWLLNTGSATDFYAATPHLSGFEQNLHGLTDAQLERVEQYWFDHQVNVLIRKCKASAAGKPSCCAKIGSWESANLRAHEARELELKQESDRRKLSQPAKH